MNKIKNFFSKFKNQIIKFFKGCAIGIAVIVPGVSGGTLAVLLNIYDEIVESVGNIFKHFKKSIISLLPIFLGVVVGLLALIKPIKFGLSKYPFATVTLFVGLIIGGLPSFYTKVKGKESFKNVLFALFGIVFVIGICFASNLGNDVSLTNPNFMMYLLLILIGIIGSSALVMPGISGSMVLLILGFYNEIIAIVDELLSFKNIGHNLLILLPFGIGVIIGFILFSKFMSFLLKKHATITYFVILGFIIGSLFGIYYTLGDSLLSRDVLEYIIGGILLIIGFFISFFIGKAATKRMDESLEVKDVK